MKISVIKNGYLTVYFEGEERQKLFPTTERVLVERDGNAVWLTGTVASARKTNAVRTLTKTSGSSSWNVAFPVEVHHFQFQGVHPATPVEYDLEGDRIYVEIPDKFFTTGRVPQMRPRGASRANAALATSELAEAERAIRLLNGLVDRGRLELVLRDGHVKAVARVTLGG